MHKHTGNFYGRHLDRLGWPGYHITSNRLAGQVGLVRPVRLAKLLRQAGQVTINLSNHVILNG